MKLEQIFEEWSKDCVVSEAQLDRESLDIPKLHNKYFRIFTYEKLVLRKYEQELKQLKLDKYEFYTQGPTKETIEKGWQLPPVGKVLKTEVPMYIDADSDVVTLSLKIGTQQEKIALLESIIKTILNRGFHIKNAIDFIKWQSGN